MLRLGSGSVPRSTSGVTTFQEAQDWLYSTQRFGVKLGLDGMRRLCAALGLGERAMGAPGGADFLHVAGTNGKGSVCAMLEAMCGAAGLRTALYTSPHLVSLRERFRCGGLVISEEELLEALVRVRAVACGWEAHPTFFEIVTAVALGWFERCGAQVVVWETGLGGRLDATNVVMPAVSVLTPVGLDHQQYLGDTLEAIAREKAGILKPSVPVVSAPQADGVRAVLEEVARERGSALRFVEEAWTAGPVGLAGPAQRWNAALAVAALEAAGLPVGGAAVHAGLAGVRWPGRFEQLAPDLVVDGAHNPAGAVALVEAWREVFPGEQATLVFGALEDKEVVGVLRELAPVVGEVVCVGVRSPRALPVERMSELAGHALPGVGVRVAADVGAALQLPARGRRLVCGSLYLVGEVLGLRAGALPEWSAQ